MRELPKINIPYYTVIFLQRLREVLDGVRCLDLIYTRFGLECSNLNLENRHNIGLEIGWDPTSTW